MNQWTEFEKWLKTTDFQKGMEAFKDMPILSQFMNGISQATKSMNTDATNKKYRFKEGKEYLDVLYSIPLNTDIEQLKLYVREDYVRIEGIVDDTIEMIKLPKLVKAKQCRAKIVDHELQLRLTKRPKPTKFYKHDIQN